MEKTKVKNNEKGITLVALVVTIIVLMILAGITLSLVLGQNGVITKAQQAKDLSTNADKATQEGLSNLDQEAQDVINGIKSQLGEYRDSQKVVSATNNTAIKDDEGNTVTIPAGFKVAIDSATKQEDGIVVEDKDGNQFVWIPVTNTANYSRTDFGISYDFGGNYSAYSETMPTDEQASVNTYHGYYIGRYETGDSISTASKTLRTSGASTTNAVAIKKGQAPYNWVTEGQSQTLAIGVKAAEGYKGTTKLCSSYAWDTAINFIQNKVSNYGTSSNQGNYKDTTFSYTDITGATQTKLSSSSVLIPTGETTPVCNIYDMGGNDWEWTTETYSDSNSPYVTRAGGYDNAYSVVPAGFRNHTITNGADVGLAFRISLYM